MERLTNIGSNGEIWITDNDETRRFGRKETAYKKLAEYEDLEEQGLLLRPQCRVGDIVYSINHNEKHGVTPVIVVEIEFSATGLTNKPYIKIICSDSDLRTKGCKEYDGNDFGKTVFLTQAEAEHKLKEMESD